MKDLQLYEIPFSGLQAGIHHFVYHLDESFFEQFEDSPIKESQLELQLDLHKKNGFIELDFNFSGTIRTECDRCLQLFEQPVEDRNRIYVKFNKDLVDQNGFEEDVIWLSENDTTVNIATQAYELAVLSLPMQRIHLEKENGEPGCDPEILKHFTQEPVEPTADPRWDALKKLK